MLAITYKKEKTQKDLSQALVWSMFSLSQEARKISNGAAMFVRQAITFPLRIDFFRTETTSCWEATSERDFGRLACQKDKRLLFLNPRLWRSNRRWAIGSPKYLATGFLYNFIEKVQPATSLLGIFLWSKHCKNGVHLIDNRSKRSRKSESNERYHLQCKSLPVSKRERGNLELFQPCTSSGPLTSKWYPPESWFPLPLELALPFVCAIDDPNLGPRGLSSVLHLPREGRIRLEDIQN